MRHFSVGAGEFSRTGRRFRADESGSVIMTVAMLTVVFSIILGVIVDTSRLHLARSQAQAAADAALLAGVATLSTIDVQEESQRIFNANFNASRFGASVTPVSVQEISPDLYEISVTVTVPTLLMEYVSESVTMTLTSQVARGFTNVGLGAEVALVLDNTGSMSVGGKMDGLKTASRDLVDAVFGSAATLTRVSFNVVPYDVGVRIGNTVARRNWIQSAWQPAFTGVAANRNSNNPPNSFNDFTDTAPLTADALFRIPNPASNGNDIASPTLAPLAFGLQSKQALYNVIDSMTPAGSTRINVGLLWGWMTLSPNWQGLWDPGLPELPRAVTPAYAKIIVLMTDGLNTIYLGSSVNDDNLAFEQMCSAIKAQGILIYTIGFGTSDEINEGLLQNCATDGSYYFHAPTAAELAVAFQSIGDRIVYDTLRIAN